MNPLLPAPEAGALPMGHIPYESDYTAFLLFAQGVDLVPGVELANYLARRVYGQKERRVIQENYKTILRI